MPDKIFELICAKAAIGHNRHTPLNLIKLVIINYRLHCHVRKIARKQAKQVYQKTCEVYEQLIKQNTA